MGTHVLQFLSSVTPPLLNPPTQYPNKSSNTTARCCATRYGGRGGDGVGSRWDSNAENAVRTERFRLNLDDDSLTDGGVDDESFGFRSAAKQRIWWSDDSLDIDDDDDDDEEEEEEEEELFGVLEGSIGIAWISKVFRAFGWMLPAIIISMLLGTGPNAFLMALALPLAQSALSVAVDTLWGRSSDSPRPKARTKRRPFARAATNSRMSKEKEQNTRTDKGRGTYQSWTVANDVSFKKSNRSTPSFGGWDELDRRRGRTEEIPKTAPTQKANEQRQQKKGKLSRRVRNRDTPLLLRLLIAIFPFLGSWTKLL